jgi:tetratricopeptide (TPR) repeat protein
VRCQESHDILQPRVGVSDRRTALRKLERYEEAVSAYTNELEIKKSTKSLNNRAFCYSKTGKLAEAIADYTEVLEMDEKNIHGLHNRGLLYKKVGQYHKAINDLTELLALLPNNVGAYFNRGSCHEQLGEVDTALADYSKALELEGRGKTDPLTTSLQIHLGPTAG